MPWGEETAFIVRKYLHLLFLKKIFFVFFFFIFLAHGPTEYESCLYLYIQSIDDTQVLSLRVRVDMKRYLIFSRSPGLMFIKCSFVSYLEHPFFMRDLTLLQGIQSEYSKYYRQRRDLLKENFKKPFSLWKMLVQFWIWTFCPLSIEICIECNDISFLSIVLLQSRKSSWWKRKRLK